MKKYWPGIKDCNNSQLFLNQACLKISSFFNDTKQIHYQMTECNGCDMLPLGVIAGNSSRYFVIDTSYSLKLQLTDGNQNCYLTEKFDDFGLYSWDVQELRCSPLTILETPERFWSNIAGLVAVLFIIFLCYTFARWLRKRVSSYFAHQMPPFQQILEESALQEASSPTPSSEERVRRLTRVASIDVFRGIAITLMVFVNYGGGQYAVFKHAPWNGLHIADVVFPFFIWIMGVTLVISLRSQLRASIDRRTIFCKIARRSIQLVILGIILNSGKSKHFLRLPGVLQRIGLTFFIAASIELIFGKPQRSEQYGPWNKCVEIVDAVIQWAVAIAFLSTHLLITFLAPVPGCPTGYLGPGGLADHSRFPNCTGGAAGYIDRLIFTPQHIYQKPTSSSVYQSNTPYDPEGLLGILNSVVMAFMGMHCGRIILCYDRSWQRIFRWILWAVLTGVAGGLLCSWSKNDGILPVNKNLWSTSYVLATTSMAFLLFTVLYWIVDVLKLWNGGLFKYAGMNSIVLYLGHEIMNKQLPWRWPRVTSTHFEVLVMDTSATVFWLLFALILYRYNIFIKL